jgi:hypothetical protein
MFDAYTVKKVLPRLAIAVILIQLSWFLTTGAIFITNKIAFGIEGLMYGAFGGPANFTLDSLLSSASSSSASTIGLSALFVVAGTYFGGGVVAIAGFIIIALVVGFLSLAVRRAILILLVLLSPVAIVCWILPNTERFWKMWWDNFTKLLIMFPLIMAMIAAGRIFAKISGSTGDSDIVKTTIIIAGFFVPLLLIPKTFALAGSAFAAMGGAIVQRGAGAQNWAQGMGKNRQKKKWANRGQQTLGGKAFKGGTDSNLRGRANRRLQQAAHINKAGLRPWKMRENIAAGISTTNAQTREKMKEDADYQTWIHNDDLNRAASETENATELREYLQQHGNYTSQRALEEDVARVEQVRKKYGKDAFRQRTTLQAIAGGTAYKTAGEQWAAVARASGGDKTAMASMVAEGRDSSMKAGRVENGGASFGTTLSTVEKMWGDPTYTEAQATNDIVRGVINSNGGGAAVYGKPASVKAIGEAHATKLQEIVNSMANGTQLDYLKDDDGNPRAATHEDFIEQLASTMGVHDAMAQANPENARIMRQTLTGAQIHDPTVNQSYSLLDVATANSQDPIFKQMRKDYTDAASAQAAASRAQQIGPTGPPAGGPPAPGLPGRP